MVNTPRQAVREVHSVDFPVCCILGDKKSQSPFLVISNNQQNNTLYVFDLGILVGAEFGPIGVFWWDK
jgi:hypothetical protein